MLTESGGCRRNGSDGSDGLPLSGPAGTSRGGRGKAPRHDDELPTVPLSKRITTFFRCLLSYSPLQILINLLATVSGFFPLSARNSNPYQPVTSVTMDQIKAVSCPLPRP